MRIVHVVSLTTILCTTILCTTILSTTACGEPDGSADASDASPAAAAPAAASGPPVDTAAVKPTLETTLADNTELRCYALPSATVDCRSFQPPDDMASSACAFLPAGTACDAKSTPKAQLQGGSGHTVVGAVGTHIALLRTTDYYHAALVVDAASGTTVYQGDVMGRTPEGSVKDGVFTVEKLRVTDCTLGQDGNQAPWRSTCLNEAIEKIAGTGQSDDNFVFGADSSGLSAYTCSDDRYAEVSGFSAVGTLATVEVNLTDLSRKVTAVYCGEAE